MGYTARITEDMAILSTVDPVSQAAGTVNGDAIDMRLFRRVVFVLLTGVMGASGTVSMKITGDTASGGSFATDITGKAITQIVKATGDNVQAVIEVTAEEVAAQNLRWIRPSVTVGTAASLITVVALGSRYRYAPATDADLASVVEVIG